MNRSELPYRIKTEMFLITPEKTILAQDRETYLMFPGGGIDEDEDVLESAMRELREETGYEVEGSLLPIVTVEWDWFLEWANTAQRKSRYEEFRGERVHLLVGRCAARNTAEGSHDDQWNGAISMDVNACLSMFERYWKTDHPNTYAYRIAQRAAMAAAGLLAKER